MNRNYDMFFERTVDFIIFLLESWLSKDTYSGLLFLNSSSNKLPSLLSYVSLILSNLFI